MSYGVIQGSIPAQNCNSKMLQLKHTAYGCYPSDKWFIHHIDLQLTNKIQCVESTRNILFKSEVV